MKKAYPITPQEATNEFLLLENEVVEHINYCIANKKLIIANNDFFAINLQKFAYLNRSFFEGVVKRFEDVGWECSVKDFVYVKQMFGFVFKSAEFNAETIVYKPNAIYSK